MFQNVVILFKTIKQGCICKNAPLFVCINDKNITYINIFSLNDKIKQ